MRRSAPAALFLVLLFIAFSGAAQTRPSSLSLRLLPAAEIPVGASSTVYTYGGSAAATLAYQPPLGLPFYVSADLGYAMIDLRTAGVSFLNVLSLGTGVGADLRFLGRLALNMWGKAGLYYGLTRTEAGDMVGGMNPYLWAGGDLSYYLSPALSLSLGAAFKSYLGKPEPLLNGVSVFLGAGYRIPLGGGEDMFAAPAARPSLLEITDIKTEAIFPVFYRYYDTHPIGAVTVTNGERSSVQNMEASVFIKRYMDSPKVVAVPGGMERGETGDIDLYALFTDAVLSITEGDTVAAEIGIRYDVRGERKSVDRIETVTLHHRNASVWDDDRRAAAFVTANDPAVLRLSKYIAGLVREQANTVIDESLRTAMAMHHALALYGLSYVVDPNSAYEDFVEKKNAVDTLQFPRQTLDYKAGDCDDLSILYCALLESVSVDTAFITVPGHIYVAFALELRPEDARKTFSNPDELIFHGERAWILLEATNIGDGFLRAWEEGIRQWRENEPSGNARIYPLEEAWQLFKPVGLPGEPEKTELPPERQIVALYGRELGRFIDREIADRVDQLEAQIAKDSRNPRLLNKLGVLYARYGKLSEAEEQFTRAVRLVEYGPSLINLGNIHYLEESYTVALGYYKRAQAVMSENPSLLLALSRTYYEMERYQEASDSYGLMAELSPEMADEYGYLKQGEGARAAEAGEKEVPLWED